MIMTILATLSVVLLMLVDEASAQSTYSVSVSQHASLQPRLNEMQVRDILKDASRTLQKNSVSNGDADRACNVTFTLKGPVRTFGSVDTPPIILDKQQRDATCRARNEGDLHRKCPRNAKSPEQAPEAPDQPRASGSVSLQ